jgi:hypothetical protein
LDHIPGIQGGKRSGYHIGGAYRFGNSYQRGPVGIGISDCHLVSCFFHSQDRFHGIGRFRHGFSILSVFVKAVKYPFLFRNHIFGLYNFPPQIKYQTAY